MSSPNRLTYDLLDVFTTDGVPFTGNALAVIYGAESLSQKQLQTIAREFNLSEVTFPTVQDLAEGDDYRVRIFTIEEELPFAGHPTLGTCYALIGRSLISSAEARNLVQQCGAGPIQLSIGRALNSDSLPTNISFSSPNLYLSPEALSIPETLRSTLFFPDATCFVEASTRISSCGLSFLYVRLKNEADIANCKANPGGVRALLATMQANAAPKGIYVYWAGVETSEKEDEIQLRVHARMFFTDPGEDAATGSAAIALGPVLLADATLTDPKRKTTHYRVTQGLEMGSPSTLLGRVVASDDGTRTAKECWCGGEAVKVGEGWIAVPPAE